MNEDEVFETLIEGMKNFSYLPIPGVTDDEIMAEEEKNGIIFPDVLRMFYLNFNGATHPDGVQRIYGCGEVQAARNEIIAHLEKNIGADWKDKKLEKFQLQYPMFRNTLLHDKWIPFARNGAGFGLMDYAPTRFGRLGQILFLEIMDSEPFVEVSLHSMSFNAWVMSYFEPDYLEKSWNLNINEAPLPAEEGNEEEIIANELFSFVRQAFNQDLINLSGDPNDPDAVILGANTDMPWVSSEFRVSKLPDEAKS